MASQTARSRPDLNNGFLEFSEDTLFLEVSKGLRGCGGERKGAVRGLGRGASVDGGLGGN